MHNTVTVHSLVYFPLSPCTTPLSSSIERLIASERERNFANQACQTNKPKFILLEKHLAFTHTHRHRMNKLRGECHLPLQTPTQHIPTHRHTHMPTSSPLQQLAALHKHTNNLHPLRPIHTRVSMPPASAC